MEDESDDEGAEENVAQGLWNIQKSQNSRVQAVAEAWPEAFLVQMEHTWRIVRRRETRRRKRVAHLLAQKPQTPNLSCVARFVTIKSFTSAVRESRYTPFMIGRDKPTRRRRINARKCVMRDARESLRWLRSGRCKEGIIEGVTGLGRG